MAGPAPGVEYPLQLGASLLGKRAQPEAGDEEYCTLRYDFKPASAVRASEGVMEVQLSNNKVSLHMGEAAFSGKYEPSKEGLDCVAIFDGGTFRLELLGAAVKNLRHLGGSGRTNPAAARAGAARPDPAAAAQHEAPAAAAAEPGPSLAEVAAQLDVPGALDAAAAAEGGAGPAVDGGASKALEEELFAALNEDNGGEAAEVERAEGQEVEDHSAEEEEEQDQQAEEEEEEEEEEGEEEEEEEEEGDEEEEVEAGEGGAGNDARQQQLAAPPPILAAPALQRDLLTADELLFLGMEDPPEPLEPHSPQGSGGEGDDGGDAARGEA